MSVVSLLVVGVNSSINDKLVAAGVPDGTVEIERRSPAATDALLVMSEQDVFVSLTVHVRVVFAFPTRKVIA
jgi:hypothetical protein